MMCLTDLLIFMNDLVGNWMSGMNKTYKTIHCSLIFHTVAVRGIKAVTFGLHRGFSFEGTLLQRNCLTFSNLIKDFVKCFFYKLVEKCSQFT